MKRDPLGLLLIKQANQAVDDRLLAFVRRRDDVHGKASGGGDEIRPAMGQKVLDVDRLPPLDCVLQHGESVMCIMLSSAQELKQETLALLDAGVQSIDEPVAADMGGDGMIGFADRTEHAVDHGTELW